MSYRGTGGYDDVSDEDVEVPTQQNTSSEQVFNMVSGALPPISSSTDGRISREPEAARAPSDDASSGDEKSHQGAIPTAPPSWSKGQRESRAEALGFLNFIQRAPTFMNEPVVTPRQRNAPTAKGKVVYNQMTRLMKTFIENNMSAKRQIEDDMGLQDTKIKWPDDSSGDVMLIYKPMDEELAQNKAAWNKSVLGIFTSVLQSYVALATLPIPEDLSQVIQEELEQNSQYTSTEGQVLINQNEASIIGTQTFVSSSYLTLQDFLAKMGSTYISAQIDAESPLHVKLLKKMDEFQTLQEKYAMVNFHLSGKLVLISGQQFAVPDAEKEVTEIVARITSQLVEGFSHELLEIVTTSNNLKHLSNVLWERKCQLGWNDSSLMMTGVSSDSTEAGIKELSNQIQEIEIPINHNIPKLAGWINFYGEFKHKNQGLVEMSVTNNNTQVRVMGFKSKVQEQMIQIKEIIQQLGGIETDDIESTTYNDASENVIAFILNTPSVQEEVENQVKNRDTTIIWPEGNTTAILLRFTPTHAVPYESNIIWNETIDAVFSSILKGVVVEKNIDIPAELLNDVWVSVNESSENVTEGNMIKQETSLIVTGRPPFVEKTCDKIQQQLGCLESSVDVFQLELENKAHLELLSADTFAESFTAKHTEVTIIVALKSVILKGKVRFLRAAEIDLREILNRIAYVPIEQGSSSKELEEILSRPDNIRRINESLKNGQYPCTCYKEEKTLMLVGVSEEIVLQTLKNMNAIIKTKRIAVDKELFGLKPWIKFFTDERARTAEFLGIKHDEKKSEIHLYGLAVDVDDVATRIDTFIHQKLQIVNVEYKVEKYIAKCLSRHGEAEVKADLMEKYTTQCLNMKLLFEDENEPKIQIRCTKQVVPKIQNDIQQMAKQINNEEYKVAQIGLPFYFQNEGGEWLEDISYKHKTYVKVDFASGDKGTPKDPTPHSNYMLKFKSGLNLSMHVGVIQELKADVIVNTTSPSLDFGGELSRCMLAKGGPGLQDEINTIRGKQAAAGDVVVTGGHAMNCKKIYHMLFNHWNDSQQSINTLRACVTQILQLASKEGYKSIVFPAVGSGGFRWPPKVVASNFLDCIHEETKNKSKLKHITMVILPGCGEAIESYADEIFSAQLGFELTENMVPKIRKDALKDVEILEEHTKDSVLLHFTIYGFDPKEVKRITKRITKRCKDVYKDITLKKKAVSYIGEKERQKMRSFIEGKGVQMTIRQSEDNCYIYLEGLKGDVETAAREINDILTHIEILLMAGDQAKGTWELFDDEGNLKEFSRPSVGILELAYMKKEDTVTFEEESMQYVVNLVTFKAKVKCKQKEKSIMVFRRCLDLPRNWFPIDEMKIYKIKKDDPDYGLTTSHFLNTLGRDLKVKIHKVSRVQNPDMFRAFLAQEKKMQKQLSEGEAVYQCQLWHGTSKMSIPQINRNGFDRGYTKVHAYGKGVYFAANSRYSVHDRYTPPDNHRIKRMYLARVLVGRYTKGHGNMVACPPIDPDKPSVKYDSLCDEPNNPTIIVIFNDAQAYPEFIVYFSFDEDVEMDDAIEAENVNDEGF